MTTKAWTIVFAVAALGTAQWAGSRLAAAADDAKGVVVDAAKGAVVDDAKGVVVADAVELSATVEAVDAEKRTVTLKGEDGKSRTIKAGPEVRNFGQIKAGDKVVVKYAEALALELEKGGGAPSADAGAVVERAPLGAKPAAAVAETVRITAEVTAIDKAKRTVTLTGPKGNSVTLKVDPSQADRLDKLAVGDDITATYTEALAISVEAP